VGQPHHLLEIAAIVGEIHGVSAATVLARTGDNARALFPILAYPDEAALN
jgi:Tat protein secretion system quality control protein TatD with DNase activity